VYVYISRYSQVAK